MLCLSIYAAGWKETSHRTSSTYACTLMHKCYLIMGQWSGISYTYPPLYPIQPYSLQHVDITAETLKRAAFLFETRHIRKFRFPSAFGGGGCFRLRADRRPLTRCALSLLFTYFTRSLRALASFCYSVFFIPLSENYSNG